MNLFDIILVFIIAAAVIIGFVKGILRITLFASAIITAYLLAKFMTARFIDYINGQAAGSLRISEGPIFVISCIIALLLCITAYALINNLFSKRTRQDMKPVKKGDIFYVNKGMGAIISFLIAVIVLGFAVNSLDRYGLYREQKELFYNKMQESVLVKIMNGPVLSGFYSLLGLEQDVLTIKVLSHGTGSEITQVIDPGKTVRVVSEDISVMIPSVSLTESKILSVKKPEGMESPEGIEMLQAFDINLGDQKEFISPIEIEIPLPSDERHGAFYLNEGEWEDIPYQQAGKTITIKTNHLSTYGVGKEKNEYDDPAARVWYYNPDFSMLEGLDIHEIGNMKNEELNSMALNKGWDAAKKWFDIGTLSSGILDNTLSGFSTINEAIGSMGDVITPIQILLDIRNGKATDAAANAYEMALGKLVSFVGDKAGNIGFLGASLINMSLKEFAQEAISTKESQYEKAYAYYYDESNSLNRIIDIRDTRDWYETFYNMIESGTKYLDERIQAEIGRYVRAIWDDPELLTAQGIIAQQGKSSNISGGGAYLNNELKEKLSTNYANHLSGYLEVILYQAVDDYEWKARQEFKKTYGNKVMKELNREYTLKAQVKNPKAGGLDIGVQSDNKRWRGSTDENGRWSLTFTMLGYIRAGTPDKIYVDMDGKRLAAEFNLEKLDVTFGGEDEGEKLGLTLTSSKMKVGTGEKLTVSASVDTDETGRDFEITWETGDGKEYTTSGLNTSIEHEYQKAGSYSIVGSLYDGKGIRLAEETLTIIVEDLPPDSPDNPNLNDIPYTCGQDIDYSKLTKTPAQSEKILSERIYLGGYNFDNRYVYGQNYKYLDSDGKVQGISICYYEDETGEKTEGMIAAVVCYKDGKKHGRETRWFINGNISYEADYTEDKLNGEEIQYLDDGRVYWEKNWVNGETSGTEKRYWGNGNLEYEGTLIPGGKYDGVYKKYDLDGSLSREMSFAMGILHGTDKSFYPDGTIQTESQVENGVLKWVKNYNSEGRLISTFTYNEDGSIKQ